MATSEQQSKIPPPRTNFFRRQARKGLISATDLYRRTMEQIKIMSVDVIFDLLTWMMSRLQDVVSIVGIIIWTIFITIVRMAFNVLRFFQMFINFPRTGPHSFSVVGSMQPSFSGIRTFISSTSIDSLQLISVENSGNNNHILRNAYILSECARLAYEPKSTIHQVCTKTWGFQHNNVLFLDLWGTQAFVCGCKKFIIVSFRGTEPFNVFDWLTDTKFRMRAIMNPPKNSAQSSSPGGTIAVSGGTRNPISMVEYELPKVHHGFMEALDVDGLRDHPNSASSWIQIREVIMKFQTSLNPHSESKNQNQSQNQNQGSNNGVPIPVFVTGHSLGGALATLFVQKMIEMGDSGLIAGVYTFGSPRCGNLAFAQQFNAVIGKRCFRFVLDEDIVPTLPISESDRRCTYNPLIHRSFVHRALAFLRHRISTPLEYVHVGNECFIEKWPQVKANFRPLYPSDVKGVQDEIGESSASEMFERPPHRVSWNQAVFKAPNPTMERLVTRMLLPSYLDDHFPTDYSHFLFNLVIK